MEVSERWRGNVQTWARAQQWNVLPKLGPGFFTIRATHGSPWPEHNGTFFIMDWILCHSDLAAKLVLVSKQFLSTLLGDQGSSFAAWLVDNGVTSIWELLLSSSSGVVFCSVLVWDWTMAFSFPLATVAGAMKNDRRFFCWVTTTFFFFVPRAAVGGDVLSFVSHDSRNWLPAGLFCSKDTARPALRKVKRQLRRRAIVSFEQDKQLDSC